MRAAYRARTNACILKVNTCSQESVNDANKVVETMAALEATLVATSVRRSTQGECQKKHVASAKFTHGAVVEGMANSCEIKYNISTPE